MKLLFQTLKKEFSMTQAMELSKLELVAELKARGVTFETTLAKSELVDLLFNEFAEGSVKSIDNGGATSSEADLKKHAEKLLEKATELNELFKSATTPEARQAIVDALDAELGIKSDLEATFANLYAPAPQADGSELVASDLPTSSIITALPMRVIEQMVNKIVLDYPLVKYANIQQVANGIKQEIYKDFRDADSLSGFADVTIADYNQGIEPLFTETYRADVEIHKGFDILSSVLNDVTLSAGLWVALVQDQLFAIARPFAKRIYEMVVTYLDTSANFDEQVQFTSDKILDKAKQMFIWLTKKKTPSRTNLVVKPSGSSKALEYALKSGNAHLVLNSAFASDYSFDLRANTFNLGEITLDVKSIDVLDFEEVAKYSKVASGGTLKDQEVLVIEDGVIQIITHYSASKEVNTPKLKSVFHRYDRLGMYRKKDKLLASFKKHTTA